MELRQLETFIRVAELKSFTQAAELLYLTQPAVTRQVAALEAELKTRLFDRLGRTVQLTAAGEALYRYAVEMLRLGREAERAVADVVTGTAGRLAIGANSTTATYLLPPLLRQFREDYPGVELSLHTGVSARVVEMVLTNEVDIGLATGVAEQPGLVVTPLSEHGTSIVVYPDHPLAAKSKQQSGVRASELAGSPLILMEDGTNLRTDVDRLLAAAGIEERITMELDNVEAIKKMIEARLGISLLPLVSVAAEVESGRLIALPLIDEPNIHRRIAALHRRDKYLPTALKSFLTLLRSSL